LWRFWDSLIAKIDNCDETGLVGFKSVAAVETLHDVHASSSQPLDSRRGGLLSQIVFISTCALCSPFLLTMCHSHGHTRTIFTFAFLIISLSVLIIRVLRPALNVQHHQSPSYCRQCVYNSLFSSVPKNFLRMLLLLVRSSSFSGAKLPFPIRPCSLLNSFWAYSLFWPAFWKTLA
jgi:hypothetical protein